MTTKASFNRQCALKRRAAAVARSANNPSRILVFDVLGCPPWAAPHLEIRPEQEPALRIFGATDRRQVDPRHGGMFVMGQMPVVIEPEPVERLGNPEVARA